MTYRDPLLDQLRTSFDCPEPWEGMEGGEGCRFCSRCQKEVYDFAAMTPRQIRARLEAGRGRICARLTREGGKLRMRIEEAPARPARRPASSRRSTAPLAATLLGAFLGVGAAAAQAPPATASPLAAAAGLDPRGAERPAKKEPRSSAPPAALTGRVADAEGRGIAGAVVKLRQVVGGQERIAVTGGDGAYFFERLRPGLYDLEASVGGFEIQPLPELLLEPGAARQADLKAQEASVSSLGGAIVVPQLTLHQNFDGSQIAAVVLVESAEILSVERRWAEVLTRLRIVRRFKGEAGSRTVLWRHHEMLPAKDSSEEEDPSHGLWPGEELVVFLRRDEDAEDAGPAIYRQVGYGSAVRSLEEAEKTSYLKRLEALAKLRGSGQEPRPADPHALVDWLVATAEDPSTRSEAIPEIYDAVSAFAALTEREQRDPAVLAEELLAVAGAGERQEGSLRPVFLGAAISEEHRQRLTAALLATDALGGTDLRHFRMVRRWDAETATAWLWPLLEARPGKADVSRDFYWLLELAQGIDSAEGKAFAASAEERWNAIGSLHLDGEDYETGEARRQPQREALFLVLMEELAPLAGAGSGTDRVR